MAVHYLAASRCLPWLAALRHCCYLRSKANNREVHQEKLWFTQKKLTMISYKIGELLTYWWTWSIELLNQEKPRKFTMISYKKYGMHPEQPKNRDAPALLWHSPCTGLGSGQSESGLLRRKKPVNYYSLNGIYCDLMRIYNALIGYEWDTWRFSWDII